MNSKLRRRGAKAGHETPLQQSLELRLGTAATVPANPESSALGFVGESEQSFECQSLFPHKHHHLLN